MYSLDLTELKFLEKVLKANLPKKDDKRWGHFIGSSGFPLEFFELRDQKFFENGPYSSIANIFSYKASIGQLSLTMMPPQSRIPPHVDISKSKTPPRRTVILFPLCDNPAPVRYLDKNNELLFIHEYRSPAVIRTDILHSVFNDQQHFRFMFQISTPFDINEIVKMHDKKSFYDTQKLLELKSKWA